MIWIRRLIQGIFQGIIAFLWMIFEFLDVIWKVIAFGPFAFWVRTDWKRMGWERKERDRLTGKGSLEDDMEADRREWARSERARLLKKK